MSLSPEHPSSDEPRVERKAVTLRTLQRMSQQNEPFACLACYDATTARWLERGGVHLLLAGDSAAQVVLGYDRTVDMPIEVAIHLTAALKRGAPNTVVMADMPFMSYQADDAEGVRNAGRFLTEGLADIVKIETDASGAGLVRKMTRAGIPVCAHIGLRPQAAALSGYRSQGRTAESAERVVDDARTLAEAGAAMLLVEAVPDDVARAIVDEVPVPLIGIGAGPAPHGQVLVVNDLLGLTDAPPRFAEPVAALGEAIRDAGREWVKRVGERSIGGHRYTMRAGESDVFSARSRIADRDERESAQEESR